MKPIGPILKKYIEEKKMVKGEVAKKVGITYNYLSTIFQKETLDATLLERLCVATGLNPMAFFDCGTDGETVRYSDIKAKTYTGNAEVKINHNNGDTEALNALLKEKERIIEEKERTIQILLAASGLKTGSDSRQREV